MAAVLIVLMPLLSTEVAELIFLVLYVHAYYNHIRVAGPNHVGMLLQSARILRIAEPFHLTFVSWWIFWRFSLTDLCTTEIEIFRRHPACENRTEMSSSPRRDILITWASIQWSIRELTVRAFCKAEHHGQVMWGLARPPQEFVELRRGRSFARLSSITSLRKQTLSRP